MLPIVPSYPVVRSSGMAFVCSRALYVVQLVASAVMTPLMLLASIAFLIGSPFVEGGLKNSFASLKAAAAAVVAIPLSVISMILPVYAVKGIVQEVFQPFASEDIEKTGRNRHSHVFGGYGDEVTAYRPTGYDDKPTVSGDDQFADRQ